MAKLQNIKAIRQMLDGTHKSQTRTSVSFQNVKEKAEHNVGDVWEDEKGIMWEQREGFKIQKGKMDELREMINAKYKVPTHCPKCGKEMSTKLDKKFWNLEKHCFDCQVAFEHKLRVEGKYEEYEKERMYKNAIAWLNDAEQETLVLAEAFRSEAGFVSTDGNVEKWGSGISGKEIADKILSEFNLLKENILKQFNEK